MAFPRRVFGNIPWIRGNLTAIVVAGVTTLAIQRAFYLRRRRAARHGP